MTTPDTSNNDQQLLIAVADASQPSLTPQHPEVLQYIATHPEAAVRYVQVGQTQDLSDRLGVAGASFSALSRLELRGLSVNFMPKLEKAGLSRLLAAIPGSGVAIRGRHTEMLGSCELFTRMVSAPPTLATVA